jgi:hypothetical protein
MNLVCFPHYTCGGLLCDIFSDKFSPVAANGGIASVEHSVGKIGDTASVLTEFSVEQFMQSVKTVPDGAWVGTHCWPGALPLDQFERVIVITTTTYRSRVYRWLRAYHHYYSKRWSEISGMELIDKTRETAKNYTVPFDPVFDQQVENVEFADVVETTAEFEYLTQGHSTEQHMTRWKNLNNFLYKSDLWNDPVAVEFARAEHEINLRQHYRYE